VHLLEAENTRFSARLGSPRVVRPDLDAADEVDVRDLVGDCVLRHRRQRPEHVLGACGGTALDGEHVGDQLERVASPEIPERPVAERLPVELHIQHLANPAVVRAVRPL
jgi:hypothetical protein